MTDKVNIDKDQFLTPKLERLLDYVSNKQEQEWVWLLLDVIRQTFPNLDIYTAGRGYGYIGFGIKRLNKLRGKLHFYVYGKQDHFYCYLNFNKDGLSKNFKQEITSAGDPTRESIQAWATQVKNELSRLGETADGEGHNPIEYAEGNYESEDDLQIDHQSSSDTNLSEKKMMIPKNQILYGAAGTGKTYHTINKALEILEPKTLKQFENEPNGRVELKNRFDQLMSDGRIRFVTFHQSFSYEDFVEGIRAVTDEETKQIQYKVESGVFKKICEEAIRHRETETSLGISKSPRVWKISIGDSGSRAYCLEHGEARIGWSHAGDLSNPESYQSEYFKSLGSNDRNTLNAFYSEMQLGDIVVCLKTASEISSVGVVGDYFFDKNPPQGVSKDDRNTRKVNWILKNIAFDIRSINGNKNLTLKTVYELSRISWPELQIALERAGHLFVLQKQDVEKKPYVLIIDEINRGNISRIFGELITLIEESKRQGADEALSVILPYSQNPFSVPDNVYIIGTMNSSDRSLTGLDIALRRRFTFIEMQPDPTQLEGLEISIGDNKLNIQTLLEIMNQRIEILLDRDHCIGHAYFMPFKKLENQTLFELAQVFKQKILPLLQEYFYDDWERINWVLNNNGMVRQQFKDDEIEKLFPKSAHGKLQNQCWKVNSDAFNNIQNYQNIVGVAQ